jgi:hypothetical protein
MDKFDTLLRKVVVTALLGVFAAPMLTSAATGQTRHLAAPGHPAGPQHVRSSKARFDQHAALAPAAISPAAASLPTDAEIAGVGNSGTTPFSLRGVAHLWAAEFRLQYDPAIVSATTVSKGAMPHHCFFAFDLDTPGQVYVALWCPQVFRPDPVLFTVAFVGLSAGSTSLGIEKCSLNDGTPMCATSDGQITVTAPSSPNPDSCANHCGESAGQCACDALCVQHGNCCTDFDNVCHGIITPIPVPVNTCQDHCGGNGGSCWCDSLCGLLNDCCGDFKDACAGDLPPAPSSTASLPMNAEIGNVGDSGTVDLSLNKSARVVAAYFDLRYDPSIVLASAVSKTGLPDDCLYASNLAPAGQVRIAFACLHDLASDGSLFSITFDAQSEGTTALQIEQCTLNEGDPPCTPSDGSLTVGTPIP